MIVELKKDILYVNKKRFRWWMIWYYPALTVFAYTLRTKENLTEIFK